MAQMDTGGGNEGGKHSKKRAKKSSTAVDMTPMVDLAFLLLTFFMLTATFSKPKTMEITFPKEAMEEDQKLKIADELATTFLIGEEVSEVFYYIGKFQPDTTQLIKVDMKSKDLRKFLLGRNDKINKEVTAIETRFKNREIADSTLKSLRSKSKGADDAPFVIIKTSRKSKYKSVIDMLDELNICNIGKYAVVDMSPDELNKLEASSTK